MPVTPESNRNQSILEILAFHTRVHLGASDEERAFPQEVAFDIRIGFGEVPAATRTDRLEDTLCYSSLCDIVAKTAKSHPFRMIEALAREVHDSLRREIQTDPRYRAIALQVAVHKLHAPVEGLRGGARFVYGNTMP